MKAFFDTVVMVLTKPNEAFGMMKTEGDMMEPLLFALIGGSAGMIVSFLIQIGLQSVGFMADRQSAIFGMGMGIVFGDHSHAPDACLSECSSPAAFCIFA